MTDDMNEGIKVLLSRMDSHPEEFERYGKWHEVVEVAENNQRNFLTEEEVKAVQDKLRATRREQFTTKIMTELMVEPPAATTLSGAASTPPSAYGWANPAGSARGISNYSAGAGGASGGYSSNQYNNYIGQQQAYDVAAKQQSYLAKLWNKFAP